MAVLCTKRIIRFGSDSKHAAAPQSWPDFLSFFFFFPKNRNIAKSQTQENEELASHEFYSDWLVVTAVQ